MPEKVDNRGNQRYNKQAVPRGTAPQPPKRGAKKEGNRSYLRGSPRADDDGEIPRKLLKKARRERKKFLTSERECGKIEKL